MQKKLLAVVVTVLFPLALSLKPAQAGWVDDWLNNAQTSTTSPGFYSGQQRGYATLGGFSYRTPVSTSTFPFSIQAPSVRTGCGGIDLNLGSMSYLDFDAIVQKLQNILQNAPAAAFDLALNTLCTPCSQTIKSMNALVDQFNSLQVNDCQASKALVGYVANSVTPDDWAREHGLMVQADALNNGMANWAKGVQDKVTNANWGDWGGWINDLKTTKGVSGDPTTQGCPADIQDLLNNPAYKVPIGSSTTMVTSMLAYVGNKWGLPGEQIDIMRGLVGDVYISDIDLAHQVAISPPCADNESATIDDLMDGKIFKASSVFAASGTTGGCQQVTTNLRDIMTTRITSISTQMKLRQPLGTGDLDFINRSPIPISYALKGAVGTDQEASSIGTLSDISAKAYIYFLLNDIHGTTYSAISMFQALSETSNASNKKDCSFAKIEKSTIDKLNQMRGRIDVFAVRARDQYIATSRQYEDVMRLADHFIKINGQVNDAVAQRFGKSIASRVMQ